MTIHRLWMRLNALAAVAMLCGLIYGFVTEETNVLRITLVIWAVTYVFRLMNNKCKKCGQSYNARPWRDAGKGYQVCPRCGTRHHIV